MIVEIIVEPARPYNNQKQQGGGLPPEGWKGGLPSPYYKIEFTFQFKI